MLLVYWRDCFFPSVLRLRREYSENCICGGRAGGSGSHAGSPVGSLEKALSLLDGEGGTIVFCGNVTVSSALTVPEQSGALLWIAQDGGMLTLAVDISFAKNTNANVITLDLPVSVPAGSAAIFGGFNSMVFGERFSVSGTLDFFWRRRLCRRYYGGD